MSSEIEQTLKSIILIDFKLTNKTSLVIGNGNNELFDIEIAKYPDGKPYIPATAYIGVLKHLFFDQHTIPNDDEVLKNLSYLFGDIKPYVGEDISDKIKQLKIEYQSHIMPKDLLAEKESFTISHRDGIELESATLLTKNGSKYDFQIIEPKAIFEGSIKIKVRENVNSEILLFVIKFLKDNVDKCNYGRNTTSGYGEMELVENSFVVKQYIGQEWINKLNGIEKVELLPINEVTKINITKKENTYFKAIIDAEIYNSLLIGSSPNITDIEEESDKTFIKYKNNKDEIPLTGKSYRQVILHRMQRIANTIGKDKILLADLKGFVNDKNGAGKRSRLEVKETTFNKDTVSENIHHRIKIDHFTGGTMNNAKFDSTPLWHKNETLKMEICIHNFKDEEAALLVQALKDLVTQDVPIGAEKSIGRGRLKGKKIQLYWKNKKEDAKDLKITLIENSITIDNPKNAEILETMNNKLFS